MTKCIVSRKRIHLISADNTESNGINEMSRLKVLCSGDLKASGVFHCRFLKAMVDWNTDVLIKL